MSIPDQPEKPRLTIRRRCNDFTSGGPAGMQVGCCCCCCCCCLHWIGAAVGGAIGIGAASAKTEFPRSSALAAERACVMRYTGCGVLISIAMIIAACISVFGRDGQAVGLVPWLMEYLLLGVIFAPSVFFLPVGLMALLGAAAAGARGRRSDQPYEKPGDYALKLGWRIAWMSLVFSSLAGGIGYLVMVALAAMF